jgi:hypothetical protein
VLFLPR